MSTEENRIVVYRSKIVLAIGVGIIALACIVCLSVLVFYLTSETFEFNASLILSIVILFFLLIVFVFYTRRLSRGNGEMIILDDQGLTLKGGAGVGPIPWNCIEDASVFRVGLEKHLIVKFVDRSTLESALDDKSFKRINYNKKTGDSYINMDLDLCKLRGIDIEAIIKERSKGN